MKAIILKDKYNNFFDGPLLITHDVFEDSRGYFYETWNENNFNNLIKDKVHFVQDNQSYSIHNTLRGLHYQLNPKAQGKLIQATVGEIFDVIVDLRINSQTFSKWVGVTLSSINKNQLWIPPGFAHGFLTLSSKAIVQYKVTKHWDKKLDRALFWDDPDISIEWPISNKTNSPKLSDKDKKAPFLKTIIGSGDIFK